MLEEDLILPIENLLLQLPTHVVLLVRNLDQLLKRVGLKHRKLVVLGKAVEAVFREEVS